MTVGGLNLTAFLLDFPKQPGVLDRQSDWVAKVFNSSITSG